ncbi:MAG: DUF3667 domain-containing protein [Flavobacteriales bacterium]|nr:DUF3667 domain-containing protein [Flavobacteriales bacterium]
MNRKPHLGDPHDLVPPHCLNCDEPLNGRFCSYCGQVASTQRLTIGGLMREVWLKFTNTEEGLPHLLRELYRHPARVCRHMVEGRRKRYSNPLSFVLVTAGLSRALNYWACARWNAWRQKHRRPSMPISGSSSGS